MGKTALRPAAGAETNWGKSALDIAVGLLAGIALTVLGTLLYALILRIFHASESSIPVFALCVKAMSAMGGGILASRRHVRKGWMRGALCGLFYILSARLIFMTTGDGFVGGWALLIDLILGTIAGSMGGILAVNRKG